MDDLISRQAAINVADSSDYVWLSVEDVKKVTDEVVKGLKRLPSAQQEIIRCKDCKYQRKWENECEAWNLCGYRPWQYTPITDEHFCSYAERKES